jgi:hypothetical protein
MSVFGIDQRLEEIEGIGLGYGVAELELRTIVGRATSPGRLFDPQVNPNPMVMAPAGQR